MPAKPLPYSKTREDFSIAPMLRCYSEVRAHIGEAYFASVTKFIQDSHCAVCVQRFLLDYYGVSGYGTTVLYDLNWGEGSFERDFPEHEKDHMKQAYEEGRDLGQKLAEFQKEHPGVKAEGVILDGYDGPYREDFKAGLEDGSGLKSIDIQN